MKKNRSDNCMKEKMGMERPSLGYFSQVREHNSSGAKPEYKFKEFELTPSLSKDCEQKTPATKEPLITST